MSGAILIHLPRNLRILLRGRALLVAFVLIAFGLNSYITQTHIHFHPEALHGQILGGEHQKHPSDDDSKNCPFCQAMVSSGVFLTAVPPLLILPFKWVAAPALPILTARLIQTEFRAWRSRAPPQA